MAFPSTSVLDNFTGTNGTDLPVYSSNWQTAPTGGVNLEIQSNAATGTAAASNNTNSWATDFGPDCEVYVTITTKPADGNILLILARGQQTTSLLTADGYCLRFAPVAGTDTLTIQRIDNGAQTSISSAFNQEVSNGDSIGLEIVGNTLTAYYKPSGGAWTSLGSTTDSTYTTAGKIGMLTSSTTIRLDDFGGGTYVAGDVTLALTGQAITSAQGSVTDNVSYALTGQATTSEQGNVADAVSYALTGQSSTAQQGTLTDNVSVAVTGQAITANQGTITPDNAVTLALTGQAITSAQGEFTDSVLVALSGQSASVNQGNLTDAVAYGITGQSSALTQGILSDVVSVALNGQQVVTQQGSVASNGDVTKALSGQSITAQQGNLSVPQENLFGGVAHFAKLSERSRKLRELEAQERTEAPTSEDIAEVIQIPQEVKEIISNVAKIDNEKKQRAQLKAQLKALEIQFKQEYADALKTEMIRQYLIMELEQQEEEEAIAMLMMALV